MAAVQLEGVSKRFPDGTLSVDQVNLRVDDRELLVLVGPSGCGKSTTLRLIAGLEECTSGSISIGGRVVDSVPPARRDIAMVFQDYALYPHMSVYNNLAFGLKLRSGGGLVQRGLRRLVNPKLATRQAELRRGIDSRVRQAAARLGIDHLLSKRPHQLSGGERQRVALGRAIVRNPAAFLFDEPLSNLDAKLRAEMRSELKRLHRELAATMIYVTHDQVEAMTLGDRVAVMNGGKLLQVAAPTDVYQNPVNRFVAQFIGGIPMNLIDGRLELREGRVYFLGGRWQIELASSLVPPVAGPVTLGVRAEEIDLADPLPDRRVPVTVAAIDRLGDWSAVHVQWDHSRRSGPAQASQVVVRGAADVQLSLGQSVGLDLRRARLHWFAAETGKNLFYEGGGR